MNVETGILQGGRVRLEPLEHRHRDGLVAASAIDPSLYRWSAVPRSVAAVERYIETALNGRNAGVAAPFATIRQADGEVIGSTRFWNLERWAWPEGHADHGREAPDTGEIGHTWLAHAAIRTGANTEAKLLLLTHAFETWRVKSIYFHTDARNERSRNALAGIGAKFEGILRAHRLAVDGIARDSARFSIIAPEWPGVKEGLVRRLAR
jgi:N-acetyltransferase